MASLKSLLNLVIALTVVSHSLLLVTPAIASPRKLNLAGQAQSLTVSSNAPFSPKPSASVLSGKDDQSSIPSVIPVAQGQTITRTYTFESGLAGWTILNPNDSEWQAQVNCWWDWYQGQQCANPPYLGAIRNIANNAGATVPSFDVYLPQFVSIETLNFTWRRPTVSYWTPWATVYYRRAASDPWTTLWHDDWMMGPSLNFSTITGTYQIRIKGGQHNNTGSFLDEVKLINCLGCDLEPSSLALDILDPTGTPVTDTLTLNDDGWPTPNPLTVQMSITNTTGMTLTNPALVLSIDSPYGLGEYEGRFYVMETSGFDAGVYGVSGVQYKVITDTASLAISQTTVLTAQVWIQPSITTTLEFAAELYTDSAAVGQDDPLGQATKLVNVSQAKIHPVVIIPGFLGTFPPEHGGKLDPLTQIYDNLIAGLERAGYEAGSAGSGATLIPFGYDWRQPLGDTGRVALRNDIEAIQNSSNQKDYVDYSKVNIIAHSAGGLVARAYIEDSSANNDQNVNRLITLATPHKGTLAAYRGWYGGDPTGIIPKEEFKILVGVLAYCKLNNFINTDLPFAEGVALNSEQFYSYFRSEVSSVPDLLPRADDTPQAYLSARTPLGYN
jgi:hypothetical protein